MKKILLTIGCALCALSSSNASLTFYEGFDYLTGSDLAVQSGGVWTNVNSGDTVPVVSGNLSVPGLALPTGNSVAFDGTGIDPQRPFTAQTSTLYYSFIINISSLGSLDTTGSYFAGFGDTNTTFGAVVWTRKDSVDGTKFNIGISLRSNSTPQWSSTQYSIGSTIFAVGNYVLNSGTANDATNLWLNPSSSSFGGSEPAATLTATGGTDLSQIARFILRQDSATHTPSIQFDELRVGTTFADVTTPVPEPQEYAVAIAGLLGGIVYLRRRKLA